MDTGRVSRIPASALAIAAIFSVQFGNASAGSFFDRVSPLGAAALRLVLAAAVLAVIARPRLREWRGRTWLGVAALGIALGGMNASIYLAIDRIPIGVAVTIELMGPLAVAAIGIRKPIDAAWVLLAVGGIVLLGFGRSGGDASAGLPAAGVIFAVCAAAFWALYIVAAARLSSRVRGIDGLVMAMVVAAIVVAPFGAADAVSAISHEPVLLLAFAGIALATSVVPYALEFIALKRMAPSVFGVLSSLGPAVAALAGLIVLGQWLSWWQLLAMLLVIGASVGVLAPMRPSRLPRLRE